jgi:hypothetical protein
MPYHHEEPHQEDFLLEYDPHTNPRHDQYSRRSNFDRKARLAHAVYDEFNRKLAHLGFYLNQTVYDEEGNVVKNPMSSSVRGGYGGALHRPFIQIERGSQPPKEFDDEYMHYYHDSPLCY